LKPQKNTTDSKDPNEEEKMPPKFKNISEERNGFSKQEKGRKDGGYSSYQPIQPWEGA